MELRPLGPELAEALGVLLLALAEAGDDRYFGPHPLTPAYARQLAEKQDRDEYHLLLRHGEALAYGMLRGWEEGFDTPFLGVAVHPAHRGQRLAEIVMRHLHGVAERRRASSVRLKVHDDNGSALALYRRLGYRPIGRAQGQLLMEKPLRPR